MGGVSCPQNPILPLVVRGVSISLSEQEAERKMEEVGGCAGAQ